MATTTRSRRSAETAPAAPTPAAPAAAPRKTPAKKAAAPRKKLSPQTAVAAAAPAPAPATPAAEAAPAARKSAAQRAAPKAAPAPAAAAPATPRAAAKKAAPAAKAPKGQAAAAAKPASAEPVAVAPAVTPAPKAVKTAPAKRSSARAAPVADVPAASATQAPAKAPSKSAAKSAANAPAKAAGKPATKAPAKKAVKPADQEAEAAQPAPAAGTKAAKKPAAKTPAPAAAPSPAELPAPAPSPSRAKPVTGKADGKARASKAAPRPAGKVPAEATAPGTAKTANPRARDLQRAPATEEPTPVDAATPAADAPVQAVPDAPVAPSPRPAPPAAPVAPPSPFRWQPPEADEVFDPILLQDTRDGSECTLQLRSLTTGDNRCTCGAQRSALDGQCEHLRFVLGALAEEPEAAAVLEHGWHPLHSEIYLRLGARRSLRWSPGSICPPDLEAAAQALQDEEGDLQLDHPAALPSLLRLADEQGQVLRVADDAWRHLAQRRDAGNRLRRLEQAYPEGPDSPALRNLLKLPLRTYQAEGALFAAVAGRALLADEDGLGKTVQAVATLELALRHFGIERVLVVGTASREPHWQQALAELAGRPLQPWRGGEATLRWASFDDLAAEPAAVTGFAPELLIVDEAVDDGAAPFDPAVLSALTAPFVLLVTREPLETRPEALLPRVEWLDASRLGPLARFLAHHLPDGPGRAPVALEDLDSTLRHLMLRRHRDDVADQLPESVELTWPAPLGADQRRLHDAAAEEARAVIARWQRSHFVSDSGQHTLAEALRRMLESCTDTGADAPAKLDALLALLPELLDRPDTRVVVCATRAQTALHAGRRLAAAGIDHAVFGASEAMRRQLEGNTQLRVVLCADSSRERLPPQPLKTVLVHLDPPCQPATQQRRLQRVQGGAPARNLPAVLLLAPDTLEESLWALPAEDRAQVAEVMAGQGHQAFLEGEALERFMATAARLLQGPARD